jgi:Protein of unknown function (DUF2530)
VELRDDQPMTHEIGRRTYLVADVEPLDVDGVRTVQVGVALWVVGFVALLPFYGRLQDAGRGWMLWTCAAGCGLGLLGGEYCRRRKRARTALREAEAGEVGDAA